MTIGERIRAERKKLKIPAKQLASAIKISRASLYRYESENCKKIPADTLEAFAKAFNTTVDFLMGWEESKQRQESVEAEWKAKILDPTEQDMKDREAINAAAEALTMLAKRLKNDIAEQQQLIRDSQCRIETMRNMLHNLEDVIEKYA